MPPLKLHGWERSKSARPASHHERLPRSLSPRSKGRGSEHVGGKTLIRARVKLLPEKNFKLPRNQGFDQLGILRDADGAIKKIYIVESKYSHNGGFRLGQTKTKGKQMGPEWIDKTINQMRISSNPAVRETAEFLIKKSR